MHPSANIINRKKFRESQVFFPERKYTPIPPKKTLWGFFFIFFFSPGQKPPFGGPKIPILVLIDKSLRKTEFWVFFNQTPIPQYPQKSCWGFFFEFFFPRFQKHRFCGGVNIYQYWHFDKS